MQKIHLGQAIQIIANLGVIAGIVFLAIEVRSASDANQLQSAYVGAEGFNQVNLLLAANPDLSRIFVVGMDDPDRLSNTEAAQFANLLRSIENQGSMVWTRYRLGLIDAEEWQFSANQIAQVFSTPGGREYLQTDQTMLGYRDALKPYMGQEMQSNFALGRDPSDF